MFSFRSFIPCSYLDKGADDVEASKPYARLFKALARLGIRI